MVRRLLVGFLSPKIISTTHYNTYNCETLHGTTCMLVQNNAALYFLKFNSYLYFAFRPNLIFCSLHWGTSVSSMGNKNRLSYTNVNTRKHALSFFLFFSFFTFNAYNLYWNCCRTRKLLSVYLRRAGLNMRSQIAWIFLPYASRICKTWF